MWSHCHLSSKQLNKYHYTGIKNPPRPLNKYQAPYPSHKCGCAIITTIYHTHHLFFGHAVTTSPPPFTKHTSHHLRHIQRREGKKAILTKFHWSFMQVSPSITRRHHHYPRDWQFWLNFIDPAMVTIYCCWLIFSLSKFQCCNHGSNPDQENFGDRRNKKLQSKKGKNKGREEIRN